MSTATNEGGDGSISKFFCPQQKKRRLQQISHGTGALLASKSVRVDTHVTLGNSPLASGQSYQLAIDIDDDSLPDKENKEENGIDETLPTKHIRSKNRTDEGVALPTIDASLKATMPIGEDSQLTDRKSEDVLEHELIQNSESRSLKRVEEPQQPPNATEQPKNPFAQFIFPSESSSQPLLSIVPKHIKFEPSKGSKKKPVCKSKKDGSKPSSSRTTGKKKKSEWVRVADLSLEEQKKIKEKWQSLADPSASLEVRRFQVLVAARLHARCQEPVVRKAMQSLREVFSATQIMTTTSETSSDSSSPIASSGLCVAAVAQADPHVLANIICSTQYYNTKAQHIVTAANEIQTRFGGLVPESEHSLKSLTGIGTVMGDLLAFVNTRSAYSTSSAASSCTTQEEGV